MREQGIRDMLDRLRAVHHSRSWGDPDASTIYRDAADMIDRLVKHQMLLGKRVIELETELGELEKELGHAS